MGLPGSRTRATCRMRSGRSACPTWRWCARTPRSARTAPGAAILDSQTLHSMPESDGHASYDGGKRKRGSKVHVAVDALGHLLAFIATPADAQDRVELAYVDQGYIGLVPAAD